jgi:diacylglycerol O-acyltransferase
MPGKQQLSGVDNAWRRMGTNDNLMTITGLLMFNETVTYEEVCDRLEERLLRFDRFRQRVDGRKRTIRRPHWETVEEMNVEDHVYDLSLPEPNDKASFQRFVGTLMSRPLDERRPLWEAYVLDGAGPDDGNAVVFRINHSIGDGFAMMHVMLGLVDNPGELEFPVGGISAPPRPDLEDDTGEGSTAADGGTQTVQPTVEESDTGGVEELREEANPSTLLDSVKLGAKGIKAGYNLLSMRGEPETSLAGDLGPTKRAAWTDRVDLEKVKAVGDAHDATVNEVLLATTAGAIRRVLDARGEDTRELTLNCTMPVNLRPVEERPESLGNYFGITFVPIPVGTRELGERIELVNSQVDLQRAGIEAYLMYQLLNLGGIVPERLQRLIMRFFEEHATGIVTNVPGPLNTAEFAGKEIDDLIFWVPQGNDQGLGISIISYNSKVRVGIASDENLLPDPTEMTDAFENEMEMLVEQVD